jgi:hypothetical protein
MLAIGRLRLEASLDYIVRHPHPSKKKKKKRRMYLSASLAASCDQAARD